MRLSVASLLIGSVLLLAGLWLAWPPSALIVAGAALVAWSLLRSTDASA